MVVVELSPNFALVLITALLSFCVHHGYMTGGVIKARKKYGVKYPLLYADEAKGEDDAKAFNCVQRGHQNSLENQPITLALLTLGGLQYPITASISGVIWLLGRIMYFQGYSSGIPEKRLQGSFGYLGLLGLLGCTVKFAYDLWMSK